MADETKPPVPSPAKPGLLSKPTVTPPGDKKVQAIKDAVKEVNEPTAKFSLPTFVDIAQVQDIYGAVRDGDYWMAFARAVAFLNAFTNPPKPAGGLRATRQAVEVDYKEFERTVNLLDSAIDGAGGKTEDVQAFIAPMPRVGRAANAAAQTAEISFADMINVLDLVRKILESFRRK